MSKPLAIRQFFKDSNGGVHCLNATFDLPTIIGAGYAPDDVINYVIEQSIELHETKIWLKDLLELSGEEYDDIDIDIDIS